MFYLQFQVDDQSETISTQFFSSNFCTGRKIHNKIFVFLRITPADLYFLN